MNATERRARANELRASGKIFEVMDYSKYPEVQHAHRLNQPSHDPNDTQCHGIGFRRDDADKDAQAISYREFAAEKMPRRDRITSEFLDLQEHPEARDIFRPSAVCEVEQTMKNQLEPERHHHPLKHTIHTSYAPVGQGVDRKYGGDYDRDALMGEATFKDPDNHVDGMLNDAYIDRGYTIRRLGEIKREAVKRDIGRIYTHDPVDYGRLPSAGKLRQKREGIAEVLARDYGEDPKTYDATHKVCRNNRNDTSVSLGSRSLVKEAKPSYLGGDRPGGDMHLYTRHFE